MFPLTDAWLLLLVQVTLVKALLAARDVLIEELHNLSKAINQTMDLPDFASMLGNHELVVTTTSKDHREATAGVSDKVSSEIHNRLEVYSLSLSLATY